MASERGRPQPAWNPYTIPVKEPLDSELSEGGLPDQKKKRKYVDQKRRDSTRRCVVELAGLINDVSLANVEKPNVSTILSATVEYIKKLEQELSKDDANRPTTGVVHSAWVGFEADPQTEIKLVVDLEGTITHASNSVQRLLGHMPWALHNTPLQRLVHPEDRHLLHARVALDRPSRLSARLLTSDGSSKTFSLSVRSITEAGSAEKFIAVVGHEQPLHFGLEQRLLPFAASHPETWVTHHSPNGNFVRVSSNTHDMLGLSQAEVLGKSPYVFYHADDITRIVACHSRTISTSLSKVTYRFFSKKLGKYVWVQTQSSLMMDDATGRPCGILCKTSFCDALSVSVLAPAQREAIEYPKVADTMPDVLRQLLTDLEEENAVLKDILDRYGSSPPQPGAAEETAPNGGNYDGQSNGRSARHSSSFSVDSLMK